MKKNFAIALLSILHAGMVAAQNTDSEIWTSVSFKKDWKSWDFSAETEWRTENLFGLTKRLSLQLEAERTLLKPVKAGASYQFMNFYDEKYSDYQLRHRVAVFAEGKQKYGNFTFALREQLQLTTKDDSERIKSEGETDTYAIDPDVLWRNRVKIKYDIDGCRITPSLVFESYFQLNNPEKYAFEKLRYTLALDYKINKHQNFSISGSYNNEINTNEPDNTYILGVGYTFKF